MATVGLRVQATGDSVSDVRMLIDSGADITLLPSSSINKLGVSIDPTLACDLMGFDGTRSAAPVVKLDLIFEERVFRGRFLVVDQPIGILGRDVLNHLSILLDGRRLEWRSVKE